MSHNELFYGKLILIYYDDKKKKKPWTQEDHDDKALNEINDSTSNTDKTKT